MEGFTIVLNLVEDLKTAIKTIKSNKEQCEELNMRAERICEELRKVNDKKRDELVTRGVLIDLRAALQSAFEMYQCLSDRSYFMRMLGYNKVDAEKLSCINRRLTEIVEKANLSIIIQDWKVQWETAQTNDMLNLLESLMSRKETDLRADKAKAEVEAERMKAELKAIEERLKRLETKPDKIPEIPPNEIICSRDDKASFLGEGTFGSVYLAVWNGTKVAVKYVKNEFLEAANLQELEEEASIHASLRNPNIVILWGVVKSTHYHTLVMELMHQPLFKLLRSQENILWSERVRISIEVASGLRYLHRIKILHRDLKSPNILLTGDRQAKLSDFGLAKVKSTSASMSKGGGQVGTPAFMAPELFDEPPIYSQQSDIYAFAIVLWEISTRELPFKTLRTVQIGINVMNNKRPDLSLLSPDTPLEFKDVIVKCWVQEPEKRLSLDRVEEQLKSIFKTNPSVASSMSSFVGNMATL